MTKTFKPIFTITNRITSELTSIERARGFLEAPTLSEDWVWEMGRRELRRMVEKGVLVTEGATNRLIYRLKE